MSEKAERLDWIRSKIERMLETRSEWTIDEHAEYLALGHEEATLLERGDADVQET